MQYFGFKDSKTSEAGINDAEVKSEATQTRTVVKGRGETLLRVVNGTSKEGEKASRGEVDGDKKDKGDGRNGETSDAVNDNMKLGEVEIDGRGILNEIMKDDIDDDGMTEADSRKDENAVEGGVAGDVKIEGNKNDVNNKLDSNTDIERPHGSSKKLLSMPYMAGDDLQFGQEKHSVKMQDQKSVKETEVERNLANKLPDEGLVIDSQEMMSIESEWKPDGNTDTSDQLGSRINIDRHSIRHANDDKEAESDEVSTFLHGCEEGRGDKQNCESFRNFLKSQGKLPTTNKKIDEGKSQKKRSNIEDNEEGDGISNFLKGCEEGKEDQQNCESFKNFLESQKQMGQGKNLEKRDIAMNEEQADGVSSFLKGCEEGKEDQQNCESFMNFLESQKQMDQGKNLEKRETAIDEEEAGGVSSFLTGCEEGNEDQQNCESFKNFLESQKQMDQGKSLEKRDIAMNEEEADGASSFLKGCEEGKEDQQNCESFLNFLESQKQMDQGKNLEKRETAIDEEEADGVSSFLKGCEEGKEDQQNCESFMNFLESQKQMEKGKNLEKRDIAMNEEEADGVSSFLKGCEEGKEDQQNCESFMNFLESQKQMEKGKNLEKRDIAMNEKEADGVSSFLKGCEEGKEDQQNCESFMNFLESQKQMGQGKNLEKRDIAINEKEADGVSSFLKGCEEGNEDQQNCESFKNFLESQKQMGQGKNLEKRDIAINEKEADGVSSFLKGCEEGKEDQQNCESFMNFLESQKQMEKGKSLEKRDIAMNEEEADGVSSFLNGCEEGKEDQQNCESFKNFLESQKQMDQGKNLEKRDIAMNEKEADGVSSFLKGCEEGKEDQQNCESFMNFLESQKQMEKEKNLEKRDIAMNEKEADGVSSFLKGCEEGKEDQQNCESFMNFLESQKQMEKGKSLEKRDTAMNEEEADGVSSFLNGCEEGKEDQQNCESFKNFLESQKQMDQGKNLEKRDIAMNEKEADGVSSFLKGCEEGKEDQQNCESFMNFLESQKQMEKGKSLEKRDTAMNEEEADGVSSFLKGCEEGKEDQQNCESFMNFVESQKQMEKGKSLEKRDIAMNEEEADGVSSFLKGCEEGKEDQQNCESFMNFLESQKQMEKGKNLEKRDIAMNEKEADGVSSFLKGCEEGKEDQQNCESFMNFLESQKQMEKGKSLEKRDIAMNEEEADGVSSFLKGCEEGKEDQQNCESFKNFLESQKQMDQGKNLEKRDIAINEKEADGVSSFLKGCEEGKEDQQNCESFKNFLESQKQMDNGKSLEKRDTTMDEEEADGVSSFLKGCEEGKEDQQNCESLKSWLDSKSNVKRMAAKNEGNTRLISRRNEDYIESKQNEGTSASDFEKDCESGREDKETCKSYFDWLNAMEEQMKIIKTELKSKNDNKNAFSNRWEEESENRDMKKSEQDVVGKNEEHLTDELSELDDAIRGETEQASDDAFKRHLSLKKRCENGDEDNEECKLYRKLISLQSMHGNRNGESVEDPKKEGNERQEEKFRRHEEQGEEDGHNEKEHRGYARSYNEEEQRNTMSESDDDTDSETDAVDKDRRIKEHIKSENAYIMKIMGHSGHNIYKDEQLEHLQSDAGKQLEQIAENGYEGIHREKEEEENGREENLGYEMKNVSLNRGRIREGSKAAGIETTQENNKNTRDKSAFYRQMFHKLVRRATREYRRETPAKKLMIFRYIP